MDSQLVLEVNTCLSSPCVLNVPLIACLSLCVSLCVPLSHRDPERLPEAEGPNRL